MTIEKDYSDYNKVATCCICGKVEVCFEDKTLGGMKCVEHGGYRE